MFSNATIVGQPAAALFVDRNNYVYLAATSQETIRVWYGRNSTSAGIFNESISNVTTLFVTLSGDVYYDLNNGSHDQIAKWTKRTNKTVPVLSYSGGTCAAVFVDYNNRIYCSLNDLHRIIRRAPTQSISNATMIAGDGTAGSTAYQLNSPQGIFVTSEMNLYVADCGNNRIQLFLSNRKNASTVPTTPNVNFSCPNSVILDADGNLFVSDRDNQRIVRIWKSNYSASVFPYPNAFIAPGNQLNSPGSLSFDPAGNLYIVDAFNHRILKLFLVSNSCLSKFQPTEKTISRIRVNLQVILQQLSPPLRQH